MVLGLFAQVVCFFYNVITAKINVDIVKEDIKNGTSGSIKHGWWGLYYLVLIAICVICDYFIYDNINYFLVGTLFLERKVIFDLAYNLFWPRAWYFTDPKSTSIVDKIYNFIFRNNAKVYQVINIIAILVLQYFIFKK